MSGDFVRRPGWVEVCVIGSGAGGAVAATRLAERGVETMLLEEGEHVETASMTQDELTMIPRLFAEDGLQATRGQSVTVMQGRSLGGGTTHNTGLCVPIPDALVERWEERLGAPGRLANLRRHTADVLDAIRARVADDDEINENNRILREGARALGLSYGVARHNRIRCSGCGYCTLGCAYNRKMSVVHAFLPHGVAAGLIVRTRARATRIARRGDGWSVEVRFAESGTTQCVMARHVVVAAGAIRTPLLLLSSGIGRRARIGRDLRLHPFAPVGAIFDRDVVAWRGVPQSILIDEFAAVRRGEDGGFLLMAAAAQPGVSAVMAPGMGAVHREVMSCLPRLAAAGVLLHDSTRGRVRERRDGKALIDYWPNRRDVDAFRRGIRVLAELFFAAGARRVVLPFAAVPTIDSPDRLEVIDRLPFERHRVTLASVHPQGTCPMSENRRAGVVTSEGAVHGAPGVWVADTSVFPTSVGVPPQITTMAFGAHVADAIAQRLSRT